MLGNRVIEAADTTGVISPYFIIPKASGKFRFILNLKDVNESIVYSHFKMQRIHDAMNLLEVGGHMAKLDLSTAYDCVFVHLDDRIILQFQYNDVTYQFRCFPNGLSEAPILFTRLLDPIKFILGKLGIKFVSYLDDMLLMHQDPSVLRCQVSLVVQLFVNLGFVINSEKSIATPTQSLNFLGFNLDSVLMKVSLPGKKLVKIQSTCSNLCSRSLVSRRDLAKLLGHFTAASVPIVPAPLHYREIQRLVIRVADTKRWDQLIQLSSLSRIELSWWIHQAPDWNGSPIRLPAVDIILKTDASLIGWGAVSQGLSAQGPCESNQQKLYHINTLETWL